MKLKKELKYNYTNLWQKIKNWYHLDIESLLITDQTMSRYIDFTVFFSILEDYFSTQLGIIIQINYHTRSNSFSFDIIQTKNNYKVYSSFLQKAITFETQNMAKEQSILKICEMLKNENC